MTATGQGRAVGDLKRLRATLGVNAGFSTITGLILLADPYDVASLIGATHPGWVRVVGLVLLPFAACVVGVATASPRNLLRLTPAIIVADLTWVAGTSGTLAASWFSPAGKMVALLAAVVVAALGWRQTVHWRRARRSLRISDWQPRGPQAQRPQRR
jgi:ABC-type uncharacterized transport system permease subunit